MKLNALTLALGCATMLSPLPVTAEETVTEAAMVEGAGAEERIARAGRLEMLVQRIEEKACFLNANVATDAIRASMTQTMEEITLVLDALENGNATIGIYGAEERPLTLAAIAQAKESWAQLEGAAQDVLADPSQHDAVVMTHHVGPKVQEAFVALNAELAKEYVNPAEVVQADKFLLELAERQSLLLEVVSTEACMAHFPGEEEKSKALLAETRATFGNTLDALRNGMPALGVRKPPTAEIADALAEVHARWSSVQPMLDQIAANAAQDQGIMEQVYEGLNQTLSMMDQTIRMYHDVHQISL